MMLSVMAAAFLGGLILNGMPCVLPIVSIKIMGLVRHQQDSAAARREGFAFLAGVMLTMLLLAGVLIAIRAGGTTVGWGFQLQSPPLVAGLMLVMLAAGLNLSGVFELGMGAQRLGRLEPAQGGMLASALSGALAIVVATPCTGPFMAGAVGYALTQPSWVGLAIFMALALGFALPVTAISVFPVLGRWLPRPGAWMETLKHGLAFPMYGAAAWLAWVLEAQAGHQALGLVLAAAIGLGFAAWLYGIGQRRQLLGRRHLPVHGMAALILVMVAWPLFGLQPMSAAAMPATAVSAVQPAIKATATMMAEPAVSTSPQAWSPAVLAAARTRHQPVLLAFTASWCITCQVNEHGALATQAVRSALQRTGTLYLQADSTRYDPAVDEAMAQLGRGGLPVYVVYPADGGKPRLLPQLLSPGMVIQVLEEASATRTMSDRPA